MSDLFHRTSSRKIWFAAIAFLLALGVPTAVLVYTSYQQIKFESLHQQRLLAEELAGRIELQLLSWIEQEQDRSFADYNFLVVRGDENTNFLQPSPLSNLNPPSELPGLLGYFQVDADGRFSSPLLPDSTQQAQTYGINQQQLSERRRLHQQMLQILRDNRLLQARSDHMELGLAAPSPQRTLPQRALSRADDRGQSGFVDRASGEPVREREAIAKEEFNTSISQSQIEMDEQRDSHESAPEPEPQPAGVANSRSQQGFDQLLQEQRKNDAELKKRKVSSDTEALEAVEESSNTTLDELVVTGSRIVKNDNSRIRSVRTEKSQLPKVASVDFNRNDRVGDDTQTPTVSAESQMAPPPLTVVNQDSAAGIVQVLENTSTAAQQTTITFFESEIEPMEFTRLDGNYWIFFRKVWRDGIRYIQGGLIDGDAFARQAFANVFSSAAIAGNTNLEIFVNGIHIHEFLGYPDSDFYRSRDVEPAEELLYARYLVAPFSNIELRFTNVYLPLGPGGQVISWAALVMAIVLLSGCFMLVRMGIRQLNLVRQQQDFVSAVSHELKTPLTSIRMYGEMLREGWADEEKRKQYYDYIHDESERLSRLIANVLQLARMTRNELSLNIKNVTVRELLDNVRSKLNQQISTAGFELEVLCHDSLLDESVSVDTDAFLQIIINLVDNGIKFSKKADRKKIQLRVEAAAENKLQFSVRDYGPGIGKTHMKKIFGLFYRAENELTRETVGTGIGLALVNQLVRSMGGSVDVVNCDPGAEFRVTFFCKT